MSWANTALFGQRKETLVWVSEARSRCLSLWNQRLDVWHLIARCFGESSNLNKNKGGRQHFLLVNIVNCHGLFGGNDIFCLVDFLLGNNFFLF